MSVKYELISIKIGTHVLEETFNETCPRHVLAVWCSCNGSDVGQINEVTLRRVQLVLGWVTLTGFNCRCGNLSQSNQPPRSTQLGHTSVGRRNEYRPKNGDALRLGVKADMVLFAGNTV